MDYIYKSYKILDSIMRNGAFSSIELNNVLKLSEDCDKPNITRIVYGVLDNSVKYDYIIADLCTKKPKNSMVTLLKVGLYLLYEMKSVPDYTAINNTVSIAKKVSKGALSGFVNGFLRKAVDYKLVLPEDLILRQSIEHSVPVDVINLLNSEYGVELTELILTKRDIHFENIRVNELLIEIKEFEELLIENKIEYSKGELPNCFSVNLSGLLRAKLISGYYTVQALASMICCETLEVKDDSVVLDCCAAPGGKAIYMAVMAPNGKVIAGDIHDHRLTLIEKYCDRMCVDNVEPVFLDGTVLNEKHMNTFDKILCDVPCSGVGVYFNKPDILFNITEAKVKELSELQYTILTTNSKYLKVGGDIIYSTCTMFESENSSVVEKFLKENPNFQEIKITKMPVEYFEKKHGVQLLPNVSKTVGFYMAKLRRLS